MPTFPLTFPSIVPSGIEFVAKTQTSKFTSPFTGRSQIYRFQAAQWWELNLQFPPLQTSEALVMSGFLTGLAGQSGTFYFTLPSMFAMNGSAAVTVAANGNDITVNSGTAQVGLFGSDSVSKRLVQFTGDTAIFPALVAGATTLTHTGSLYRLASNEVRFSVDEARNYGIVIPIVEAI